MTTTTAQTTDTRRDEGKGKGKEGCRCCGCTRFPHLGCAARAAVDSSYMQAAIGQQAWEAK
jgi:hypothetical protein